MSDKPKTAVQWLMEQISYENGYGERYNTFTNQKDLTEFFKQALAMEREQHKFNFECGRNYQLTGEGTFEETHTETYGE
jgi:hypothetical protein